MDAEACPPDAGSLRASSTGTRPIPRVRLLPDAEQCGSQIVCVLGHMRPEAGGANLAMRGTRHGANHEHDDPEYQSRACQSRIWIHDLATSRQITQ